MTFVSYSGDFALHLEEYLMYEQNFETMGQYDPTFDLKINVGL